jgi:uncharacterized membrane protein YphA (DoxX/SURF4 family)
MLKKVIFAILCSLLGAVFIFSGYTKLYPIEPFEYTFVDIGFINWQAAPFVARILIGLEFLIGILLLLNLNPRKIAYKLGILALLIFCIYLILLIFLSGNKGNCGCFGSSISMTPLQALIKNAVMLIIFFVLYKFYDDSYYKKFTKGFIIEFNLLIIAALVMWGGTHFLKWHLPYLLDVFFEVCFIFRATFLGAVTLITLLKNKNKTEENIALNNYAVNDSKPSNNKMRLLVVVSLLASFAMPFILNPVELNYSEAYLNRPADHFKLELDSLYNNATHGVPPKTLSNGKHILAFMSLTCPHCRIASNKMRIIHERNPEIPFYFILNGEDKNLVPFFENTHTEDIPHCMLLGRSFVYLAGTSMPTIYLVNNSIVENDLNYMDMDQEELEKWLKN